MLEIQSLSKTYTPDKAPPVKALQDISIKIRHDELVAIVGESGSGKSTLLNILGGLDKADSGSLIIDGVSHGSEHTHGLADYRRDTVGFVFQDFNLISHMTVRENVALALSTYRVGKAEKERRVDSAIMQVGLLSRADNKARELSGGQKQRVAIARALVKNPKIILADEPTGALDSETSADILDLFKSLSAQGNLVILVTHDDGVAAAAHRCIRLHDGRVVDDNSRSIPALRDASSTVLQKNKDLDNKRSFNVASVFALSWHRIVEKRWRYLLISMGISVGIAGLILAQTLGSGVNNFLQTSSNQIVDSRKATVIRKDENFEDNITFEFKKTGLTDIVQAEHDLQARFDQGRSTEYFGIKPLHRKRNQSRYATPVLIAGRLPLAGKKGALVTPSIALKLIGKEEVETSEIANQIIGKTISLKVMSPDNITRYPSRWDAQSLTVVGLIKPSFVGDDFAYVPYEDHINIAKRSRFLAKNATVPTNTYHVYLKDESSMQDFATTFREDYEVITPENVLKSITGMFSQIQLAIFSVSGLILLICGVMAGILFFISVLERQKEIGIFKALGGNNRDVRWILFSEAILIGCIASVLGAIISFIVPVILEPMITAKFGYALLSTSPKAMIFGMIFGVCVTALSALQPANNAARLDPIKLLRKD